MRMTVVKTSLFLRLIRPHKLSGPEKKSLSRPVYIANWFNPALAARALIR